MPTAVVDLEFEKLPESLSSHEGYEQALVLLRMNGIPIGQSLLPIVAGTIGNNNLKKELMEGANWSFWQYWLNNYLGIDDDTSKNPESLPAATVAVCTRDRTDDLRRCLESLINMPDDGQEIIVIDNCPSSDSTRRLVEKFGRVRYVREDISGVNKARNRALKEAKNSIVAITDDDAVADPQWLRTLLRNFEDPLVLCVTGLTMPLELDTGAQECFEKGGGFSRGFYRRLYDSAEIYPQDAGNAGASVNMAIRKSVSNIVGLFDECLGPGTPARSGSETELFFRILSAGYRIVYDPRAVCWHRHRRTWTEVIENIYGYKVGEFAIYTRSLLFDRELDTPWFAWKQVERCLRPFGRPLSFYIFELLGCLVGPWAYLYSRWVHRKRINQDEIR